MKFSNKLPDNYEGWVWYIKILQDGRYTEPYLCEIYDGDVWEDGSKFFSVDKALERGVLFGDIVQSPESVEIEDGE